jgi:hypothetical protein
VSAQAITKPPRPVRDVIDLDDARECPPALLTPGEYALAYVGHETARQFGRSVLVVYFELLAPEGVAVVRYYNIEGKADGRWRARPHGDLVRDFRRVFPEKPLGRLDRFPIHWLADQHVIGRIGTVEKNHEGAPLNGAEYSVVRELLRSASRAARP